MYRVRLVCEGPTDGDVFAAVLDAHLHGGEYQLTRLQPVGSLYGGDAGPHGGGWKGVRGWCRAAAESGGLEAVGALGPDVDALVIHVDADIAADPEHGVRKPCPPPAETIEAVETIVMGWLGVPTLPARVVLWVPCMATESWVLRGLFPSAPQAVSCLRDAAGPDCVECRAEPAQDLLGKTPKLVIRRPRSRPDGSVVQVLKKQRRAYRDAVGALSRRWADLVANLFSAQRLGNGLARWIPTP